MNRPLGPFPRGLRWTIRLVCIIALCGWLVGCGGESSEGGKPPVDGTPGAASPSSVKLVGAVTQPEEKFSATAAGTASDAPVTGYGQVTMVNQTTFTLDLYVDGEYGCRALRNLICTTQVRAGTHTIVAKGPDNASASTQITLASGDSLTWTVTQE